MTDPNTFDETADRSAGQDDHDVDGDHARRTTPLGDAKHDHLADRETDAEDRQEALIDEGVEETFPASDPATPKRIT